MPLAKSIYWTILQSVFTLEKVTLTACPLQTVRFCWTNTGVILRCGSYCTLRKTSLLAKPTDTLTAMGSFKLGYATSEVIHLSGKYPTFEYPFSVVSWFSTTTLPLVKVVIETISKSAEVYKSQSVDVKIIQQFYSKVKSFFDTTKELAVGHPKPKGLGFERNV